MNNNFLYNAYIYYIKLKYKEKYADPIEKSILKINNINSEENKNNNIVKIKDIYQIIGIYDNRTYIWLNGWALINYEKSLEKNLVKTKELLLYILNFEKDMQSIYNKFEKTIIKSILINSKIYVYEKKTQLDIILAIICYLLKAKNIFKQVNNDITIYYAEI